MFSNFTMLVKKHKVIFAIILIVSLGVLLAVINRDAIFRSFFKPTDTNIESGLDIEGSEIDQEDILVVADNLTIPWALAFLPSGDMLVTERPGTLLRIGDKDQRFIIEGVRHIGEGGLLGLTLHPNFEENRWIYLYMTTEFGDGLVNRVERYRYEDDELHDQEVIIAEIPGARFHDGGRIAFGPDTMLYITTGDALIPELAQDRSSLAGKILRLHDDGSIPEDNPFESPVYSFGHRNPQGITWDDEGRMWSTEHGASARDEINLIEAGKNYGWPEIEGTQTRAGMEAPIAQSGSNETWAPSGMTFYDGSLFFAGLRGQTLYEAIIQDDGSLSLRGHLRNEYGRLRAVELGPDGFLYVLTSNTDGRGNEQPDDDKIIRINPDLFRE